MLKTVDHLGWGIASVSFQNLVNLARAGKLARIITAVAMLPPNNLLR